METQFIGKISAALKIDDPDFLIKNFDRIKTDYDLNKSLLSLCLENKAFKCFRYLANNGFKEIFVMSYGVALREDNKDIINIIEEFNLFDINGEKGKTLLNLCIANKDEKLFNKIKDIIIPSANVLEYALQGQNREAIELYQRKGYKWVVDSETKNPLIYIHELYQSNKKGFIKTVLESSQKEDLLKFATQYFTAIGEINNFNKLLPK